jgi:hypothetical protein
MIKPIAFYLPQYHPIPENDEWWGKGFTEWTNVTKAKPLFKGHWQPRLPADLGFYDLRVEASRIAQAELAKAYGIYGFAYWHYWFGNGKQLLERPIEDVVASSKPDFPFCLAWANETWSGTWHGLSNNKILIEQQYPGEVDFYDHFYKILPVLKDPRYIKVNGKCLFIIYRVNKVPDLKSFTSVWRKLAEDNGLSGFHFVACHENDDTLIAKGINAFIQKPPSLDLLVSPFNIFEKIISKITQKIFCSSKKVLRRVDFSAYVKNYPQYKLKKNEYPLIFPDWDNSPRTGYDGWMFTDSTPKLFGELVKKARFEISKQEDNPEKILIIKSWNEWAEGNYLEPDKKFGISYLSEFSRALND